MLELYGNYRNIELYRNIWENIGNIENIELYCKILKNIEKYTNIIRAMGINLMTFGTYADQLWPNAMRSRLAFTLFNKSFPQTH